ncbi:MAG: 2-oxoisovalerate dehydrogenase [Bacteroidia bacterium]|nr:2-oxoisovalerate dehydrogenase [Bacteroidia bacterium]
MNGVYEARAVDYDIFTEAPTLEELKVAIREAVDKHFKTGKYGEKPALIHLHIVKEEILFS